MTPFYAPEKTWTPAPDGLHVGICVDFIDHGIEETQYGRQHRVSYVWQVGEVNPDTQKRFTVRRKFTLTLGPKSGLGQMLEGWFGRKLTDQERYGGSKGGIDFEAMLNRPAQLQVTHRPRDGGGVWANVANVMPLADGQTPLDPDGYIRDKDKDTSRGGSWEAPWDKPSKDDEDMRL